LLPWVHIMISNAKRWIDGIFHHVNQKYFQNYLNEFCYKQNRRYFNERLFDRLLIAAATLYWKPVYSAG
ncbi:MAG: transposase, partial [Bacteroidota bacterium]